MNIPISSTFRQKTTKAVFSIFLFVLVYIFLLVLSVGLTALCIWGGFMIIAMRPSLFTLVLGLGLASIGVLILIFLVKFMFKKHRVDLSSYIELYRDDQPRLFDMIDSIVDEVGTNFPKKIFVSQEVNASVFYDSSFWSMFFPVKKNLHIGMGLVNAISEEELKAILSHEFGHFSQKSMKVGSYVYQVNQVIFNMLYDNESYHNLINSWARISNYFVFFVNIALRIIEGIKWLLRKMYAVVNKSYLELSREMEFHADAVAATVTGYVPLKNSLLRMDLANQSYQDVLEFYGAKFEDALVSANVFEEQSFVLQFLAKKDKLPLVEGLPMVSETNGRFMKSKLVVGNQWASHPETQDRIAALESLNLVKPTVNVGSANGLFSKLVALQERLTRNIFAQANYAKPSEVCTLADFKMAFQKEYEAKTFNVAYNGYYDRKNPMVFDLTEAAEKGSGMSFDDLFGEAKIDLVYEYIAMQQDVMLLENISKNSTGISTFDYEGVKYKAADALSVKSKLDVSVKSLEVALLENDKNIYGYFYALAKQKSSVAELESRYQTFFEYDTAYNSHFGLYQNLANGLHFTHQKTSFGTIMANFKALVNYEKVLKEYIAEMLENSMFVSEISVSMRRNFELYLSKDWRYFDDKVYNNSSLNMFVEAVNAFQFLNYRGYFLLKKDLVDFQMGLLD